MSSLPSRSTSIIGASIISLTLIALAYIVPEIAGSTRMVDAQSTTELLKEYAKQDADQDGLPDWQEALYGTDPADAHSVSADMTDREAVTAGKVEPRFATAVEDAKNTDIPDVPGIDAAPDTLTAQFARQFFGQYLTNRGKEAPSEADMDDFITGAVDSLAGDASAQERFAYGDLTTEGSATAESLKAYAARAEQVILNNSAKTKDSELAIFQDYLVDKSSKASSELVRISKAYKSTATAYAALSVPREAAFAHLKIANAIDRIGTAVEGMSVMQTDPLRTMVALVEYNEATTALGRGLAEMRTVFGSANVTFEQGSAGFYFSGMMVLGAAEAAN